MSPSDETPGQASTDLDPTASLPDRIDLAANNDEGQYRAAHEYPEIRTDDGSRPHDDQELRDEVNEQMNLFWGAVSSAFAEPAGHEEHEHVATAQGEALGEVDHDLDRGHHGEQAAERGPSQRDERDAQELGESHYPAQDETSQHVIESEHGMHTSERHADIEEDPADHPRNEWEHVQLLMSLGGQLGQDLDGLEDGHGGAEMSGSWPDAEAGPSGSTSHDQDGHLDPSISTASQRANGGTSRSRTRRARAVEAEQPVNAEAGPSRLPDTITPDPSERKTRKRAPRQPKAKLLNPDGTPQPARPKAPRKPRTEKTTPNSPAVPRALLSAAEKRANHVSSEKRRRNAIRIGYAELGALEHMSVNRLWPATGDLEAVIEESKDMEGMEELVGRKRPREDTPPSGDGQGDRATPVALAGTSKGSTKRPRKGIYIVNQGMTSKSAILKKGASLAQWLTEGNEWLSGEVERLEGLLGVAAGQALDPEDEREEAEEEEEEEEEEEVRHEEKDGEQVRQLDPDYGLNGDMGLGGMDEVGDLARQLMLSAEGDTHMHHVEHHDPEQHPDDDHHHLHDQAHQLETDEHQGEHDTRMQHHLEHDQVDHQHHDHDHHEHHDGHHHQDHHLVDPPTTIEEHFIQAVEALRPAQEEMGPDGYPRDMY